MMLLDKLDHLNFRVFNFELFYLLFDFLPLQFFFQPLIGILDLNYLDFDGNLPLNWSKFEGIGQKVHENLLISSLVSVNASQYLAVLLIESAESTQVA